MKRGLSRRDFIATGGVWAAASMVSPRLLASALNPPAFDPLVPSNKRLDPAWVKSLTARGAQRVYSGSELGTIGMPVSGLCSGQLYLGGDGKLWLWDVFNLYRYTSDIEYRNPVKPFSPVDQGFALRVTAENGPARIWTLDAKGFPGVEFRGEYPIGRVDYRDAACPVSVALEAFSPFAPLDTDDSSLPATLMRFTVKNPGPEKLRVEIGGWLENKAGLETETVAPGVRKNRVVRSSGLLLVEGSVQVAPRENPDASQWFNSFQTAQIDIGTLAIALLGGSAGRRASAQIAGEGAQGVFAGEAVPEAEKPFGEKITGAVVQSLSLESGQESVVVFALAWHFPNLRVKKVAKASGRYYANRFGSATAVAEFLSVQHERLHAQTKLWRDTWYDSTLPWWFLDRTLANASTLATSTAYRFANGRFYGWEGVGNCSGTCTHVWGYEQTMGRLFPELDRALMEKSYYNPEVAFHPDGQINFRDEFGGIAVDGQAGTILRSYRLHQMSPDAAFLRGAWPAIKQAMAWLMAQDTDGDGILDRNQGNTLDAEWYGKIPWLSGLYLAALRAAAEMAADMEDGAFAGKCLALAEAGQKNLVAQCWNGRFFVQVADPRHADVVGSYAGCEIDQVLGQSWALQVGLGRVFPEVETRRALQALWQHNFDPDVGPYRAAHPSGRWFALSGEAGTIMCTQPDGTDRVFKDTPGAGTQVYLNECMNGFEHQVAGHMIGEGMVLEGLAVERAVHDRYDAAKRNPWNEIECGNHYARSMASFGVFLAACGYEYHGPKGRLAFAPRIQPEDFRSAFVTAEGWGSYAQKIAGAGQTASLELKWGRLRLRSFALVFPGTAAKVDVEINGRPVPARHRLEKSRLTIEFADDMRLVAGDRLAIVIA